ncbi:hypothetical protein ONS96_002464 [Cadophora gregata f. sp. sojae]|nr:hypothetical protein ONS96_002464 [Cadophora gregata f. sp. sojae]
MPDHDITPDATLLNQIFTTHHPETISILLQNLEKCIFRAEFPNSLPNHHHAARVVVRLEAENENLKTFTTIAAIQRLAASIIPNLVPQTLQVGKVKNAQGRIFNFSVIEFVEGELLDDVWWQMSAEEQRCVVIELVEALEKLHNARLSDTKVQEILGKSLREEGGEVLKSFEQAAGIFGGPHTGYLNGGPALLESIMERRKLKNKPFCTMESLVDSQAISIQSNYEELGSILINTSDIDKWSGDAVLCHNDLTPRNLILQSRAGTDGEVKYKLAGIIDWELAGFYPPSYELSLQDTYLSGANRHISFYLLLKEQMKDIVPRSSSQVVLLEAMELIYESQQRLLLNGTNIPAHIRKRFLEELRLVRDSDPYVGWARRPRDGPFAEYSSADIQKLEDDVVEEMIARRRLKGS